MTTEPQSMTTGAETLVETLKTEGIEYLFCSPIGACGPVWEVLARQQAEEKSGIPKYINCRHELLAVALAVGYFKASGRPQVCMLPTGLGVLNGAIGLHDALQERVALTVITPDTRSFGLDPACDPGPEWPFLLTDLGGPVRDAETVTKWSHVSGVPLDLTSNLQRALYFANAVPRGPTLLSVPLDVLVGALPKAPSRKIESCPVQAGASVLRRTAELLAASRHPIIITGHAGRQVEDRQALTRIAELLGAPVFESLSPTYHNIQRSHPLHGRGSPSAEVLREADCILVAGSNGPWHPAQCPLHPDCTVIIMEEDPLRPRAPFWGYRSNVCVAGEIGVNLRALCDLLDSTGHKADPTRTEFWHAYNRAVKEKALAEIRSEADQAVGIHPYHLFDAMRTALPEGAAIVDEIICQHAYMMDVLFRDKHFEQFRGYGGALGQGIAQALGVKLAQPDRVVVAVIGDGAYNYTPVAACFGMAQQYRVPILVIVCNNHGYNSQKWLTQHYFPDGYAARNNNIMGSVIAPDFDYSAVAAPFGAFAQRVTRTDDLGPALEAALTAMQDGRFAVMDVHVHP